MGLSVVGVGASAGGLEALRALFSWIPARSGLAFVVIQHLDPKHETLLPELLQRTTALRVTLAEDGVNVAPDRIYVIPSNHVATIRGDALHLKRGAAEGSPIDAFLVALAEGRGEQAIGVILSGMGADGTAGLLAIKERGGLTLAQDPENALFGGMPQSAIDAGVVDVVGPPRALAEALITRCGAGLSAPPGAPTPLDDATTSTLRTISHILLARTGHDFSLYKDTTLLRRVERRIAIHQLGTHDEYVAYLRDNPAEVDLLFKELLIGVTSFFRDPEAWIFLEEVLPGLLVSRPPGTTFRAWVPGCSTGEEAYSLAILFHEVALSAQTDCRLQIFATDIDVDALSRARQGLFPVDIEATVSEERRRRFFFREAGAYRVRKEIRDTLIFAPQNVAMDPPFTRLDIVSCRNLLIYLKPALQRRLLALFHYSLNPEGLLLLGSADAVGDDLFTPVRSGAKLFRRTPAASPPLTALPSTLVSRASPIRPQPVATASLEGEADRFILRHFAPPTVLVDDDGDILYCSGNVGRFLEPAAGKANWNILAMAREGLLHPLSRMLTRTRGERGSSTMHGVRITTETGVQAVDITVRALTEPGPLAGKTMIVLAEGRTPAKPRASAPSPDEDGGGLYQAAAERDNLRRELQLMREYMQTSQEDMMSTNEELQSMNEELQSTNEELTTSREEMQSMNEELQTLNAELQAKVDELSRASDDMRNLLDSTEIATVFLDSALNVRRFTTQATRLIRLIPSDVGRPITDITTVLRYPELADDVRGVLDSLASCERQVETKDGQWFNAKIMPYRTIEDEIAGVVMTFSDITAAKELETKLRLAGSRKSPSTEVAGPRAGDGEPG